MICRGCGKHEFGSYSDTGMVKYGVRHYIHGGCAVKKWGTDVLDMVPRAFWRYLPALALKEIGLLDRVLEEIER